MALIAAVIAEVLFDISTRLARRLVSWSAYRIYVDDPERAKTRAKEWRSVIEEAPKYFSLFQAVPFAGVAVGKITARRCRAVRVRLRQSSALPHFMKQACLACLVLAMTDAVWTFPATKWWLFLPLIAVVALQLSILWRYLRPKRRGRSFRASVGISAGIQYTIVRRRTPDAPLQRRDDKALPPGESKQ